MASNAPFPSLTKTWHTDTYDAINPTRPELSAAGKVVLITGGGSGIGRATAFSFAAAGCAKLALVGRRKNLLDDTAKAITAKFPNVQVLTPTADITKEDQINAAFDTVAEHLGPVDVFVSNSGFLSTPASVTDSEVAEWWASFETNVLGQFLAARAFLKHAGKTPILISITSGVATMPALPIGGSAYVASKIAAVRIFDFLLIENKDKNLKVFNVHPGVVESELNIKSKIGGMDKVELPADFNVWMASPEADFLNGKSVWCNFDVDELVQLKDKIATSKMLELELGGVSFEGWVPAFG